MHKVVLPFGPQHPALPEAVQLTLYLEGEEIKDVVFQVGYHHRGIEKVLETKDWMKNVFFTERVCGICNISHSLCYCQAVESLLGIEIPEQAKWIRTFFNELERMQSHLLWLGLFGWEMGFDTLFMLAWRDREHVLDIAEMISGNRIHESIITIGGVRRNILPHHAVKAAQILENLTERISFYKKMIAHHSLIKARSKKIGELKRQRAEQLSVVGPVARASGIDYDIRKIAPYAGYADLDFKPVIEEGYDCYARLKVRIRELEEAEKLARLCLTYLSPGPIVKRPVFIMHKKETISTIEAPRGELVYYVKVRGKYSQYPQRIKIKTPTYANLHCLKEILLGHQLADVPVIVSSLDPCIACTDRAIVIRGDKRNIINLRALSRKACDS